MKRKKNTPEQIVTKLRQAQMEIGKGATVDQVSRKLGVTEQTYYRWKREYGGMEVTIWAGSKSWSGRTDD